MKGLITFFLALCLCLCATFAMDQGDPGPGDPGDGPEGQSGVDVFFPGMSRADALKAGAAPAGDKEMNGKIDWDGVKWDAHLVLDGDEVKSAKLKTGMAGNDAVFQVLKAMEERLYEPLVITSVRNGEKKETNAAALASKGKDAAARNDALLEALNGFAGQEEGSLVIVFCPTDMIEEMGRALKEKGGVDGKAVLENYGESIVYSLELDKKTDGMTVDAATLSSLGVL